MHYYTIFTAYVAIVGTIATLVAPTAQPTPNIEQAHEEAEEEQPVAIEEAPVVVEPEPAPMPKTEWTKEEVIELIKHYSEEFGADETIALNIAKCESGYKYNAKNGTSSATGVYQTIKSTAKAWNIEDPTNAEQNVRESVRRIADGQYSHWNTSRHCWGN
jgi:hypothetical protein